MEKDINGLRVEWDDAKNEVNIRNMGLILKPRRWYLQMKTIRNSMMRIAYYDSIG